MDLNLIINLSVIGAFVLMAAIGFIRGIFKGAFRSVSDLVFVLINAIASVFISKGLASLLLKPQRVYDWMTIINEKVGSEGLSNALAKIEPHLKEGEFLAEAELDYVLALPIAIITPIIFMLVFVLMGLIFKIIKFVLQKLWIPKTQGTALKMVGGVVGALRYVLAFAIFIMPLVGYATFGVNAINHAGDKIDSDSVRELSSSIEEYEECVLDGSVGIISSCGGQWLFEVLSTTSVDDIDVSLTGETDHIIKICGAFGDVVAIDYAHMEEKDVELLSIFIDRIEESQYLVSLVSSVFSQVAMRIYEQNEIMGFELPYLGDSVDPLVQTLVKLFSTADAQGVVEDMRTFTDIVGSAVKHGLVEELNKEDGDVYKPLQTPNLYSEILVSLYENERTRPILPSVINAMQEILYEVYEKVNGTPYGSGEIVKVDESKITREEMNNEGIRIALAIQEIRYFSETVEQFEYVDEIVKAGDFSALGRALNRVKSSVFFGGAYRFLLDALLKSETCVKLGIFDKHFVENATKPDADMEQLLLSRQSLARLTMAMWDGDQTAKEDALRVLIEQATDADKEALKELAVLENLKRYGVKGEKGEMVSAIAISLADTISSHQYFDENGDGSIEDEKHIEAEKTAHILTVITGAYNGNTSNSNMFDNGDGLSKTGESASGLVDSVMNSDIAKEMIGSAVAGGNEDPYNIDHAMSAQDKEALSEALSEKYSGAASSQEKQDIKNIAQLFGVEIQ